MKSNTVVIIPVFREQPLWYEVIAIEQAVKVLNEHDHVILCPQGLCLDKVLEMYSKAGKQPMVIKEDPGFFENTNTYNQLLLSAAFYQSFSGYEYLLIHQTDAYVFRDELAYWVSQGYDYVGAPWIDWIHASYHQKNKSLWGRVQWRFGRRRFDAVGNGGLSLRKVASMISILDKYEAEALAFAANEDFFFSFEVHRLGGTIKIPVVKEALQFAFDEYPEKAFAMSRGRLPMGVHAWPKYQNFWKAYIVTVQSYF